MEETTDLLNPDHFTNEEKTPLSYEPPKEKEPILAQMISIILHPMFMGVYTVSLLFLYTDFNLIFAGQFIRFITPILFLSCVVPASSMYFLKRSGLIKNYNLNSKDKGFTPYLITFLSYTLLIYYFQSAHLYTWFIAILATPLLLITITAIIKRFWKISIHMIGIGALIGCTLSVCYNIKGVNPFVLFIILFILAGCLGVSRLILKRHTPAQVYVGFLVGLVGAYLCVWIGAYWGFVMFLKNL